MKASDLLPDDVFVCIDDESTDRGGATVHVAIDVPSRGMIMFRPYCGGIVYNFIPQDAVVLKLKL